MQELVQEIKNRKRLEAMVIRKAILDTDFRALLKKDPREAIQQFLEGSLPSSINVKIVEEDPSTMVIALPKVLSSGIGELSDDDLERVTGGVFCSVGKISLSSDLQDDIFGQTDKY